MCACGCIPNSLTSGEAFCELDHTAYILLLRGGDRRSFNLSRFFGIERGWRTASHLLCALISGTPAANLHNAQFYKVQAEECR
jgi:hypothetical protein